MIKTLTISGFRGFGKEQNITFSLPNGKNEGSGLNILVGANNTGKSSIIEAIKAFNAVSTFSEGKRNSKCGQRVSLKIIDEKGTQYTINTVPSGGSQAVYNPIGQFLKAYVLPSRRHVEYEFSELNWNKDLYISQGKLDNRKSSIEHFNSRLFEMMKNKEKIDELISFVVGKPLDWTIEQNDAGRHYVKFNFGTYYHSSEGVGDGLWSILTICDALYDSSPSGIIVIDEPELSLHPAYQKRVLELLLKYSKDRQIIISTHSPYFISWQAISKGAALIRTQKNNESDIEVNGLSDETKTKIGGYLRDLNNPHVLGLNANEVFFLDDNIIVTEGQEDVVLFGKALSQSELVIHGDFYGWGAGGASKEKTILSILCDLGYKHVVAIFDGDKREAAEEIEELFKQYKIIVLPKDDIRDKDIPEKKVEGIMTEKGRMKDDYKDWFKNEFIDSINRYFET